MRGGKEHARQTQPTISDDGPRAPIASSSGTSDRANAALPDVSESSATQPTGPDVQSRDTNRTPSESNSGIFQDILVECNSLVEAYRKGESSKASIYADIQSKLSAAFGGDRAKTNAAFGSFIATIESLDSEDEAAAKRGGLTALNTLQRSPSPPVSVPEGHESDDEPAAKRVKVDKSAYAWVASRKDKRTVL
jgi:hypothetical protein